MTEAQKEGIEKCIDDMLDQGVICPSASPWASPVVLVKKPDGSDRFCANFQRVKAITKKDSYPLPRIAENLDALLGTQYFSSMDLMSGYWQIEMDPARVQRKDRFFHPHWPVGVQCNAHWSLQCTELFPALNGVRFTQFKLVNSIDLPRRHASIFVHL